MNKHLVLRAHDAPPPAPAREERQFVVDAVTWLSPRASASLCRSAARRLIKVNRACAAHGGQPAGGAQPKVLQRIEQRARASLRHVNPRDLST
jgi:hypothetical protein